MGGKRWTSVEESILTNFYGKIPIAELLDKLSPRTYSSVHHRAERLNLSGLKLITEIGLFSVSPLNLTCVERGYLAGILDGEGCLQIIKDKRRVGFGRLRPYVYIASNTLELLKKIQKMLGSGSIYERKKQKPNHKIGYTLVTYRMKDMYMMLKEVFPFMIVKRRHAELILEFLDIRKLQTRKVIKGSGGRILGTKSPLSTKREIEIYNELRKINKRGV